MTTARRAARAVLVLVTLVACKSTPAPSTAPAGAAPEPAQSGAATPPAPTAHSEPAKDSEFEAVAALVAAGSDRQKCNDLNGCAMVEDLAQRGPAVASALQRLYRESKGDDYWRFRLLEAIGRSGDASALPFLLSVLGRDRMTPARVEAARAIGRLGQRSAVARLLETAKDLDPAKGHAPVLQAIAGALVALGDRDSGVALLEQHFVVPDGPSYRWDLLRPGVEVIGEHRLERFRSRIEEIALRADVYVRREAIRTLAALRSPASFPVLIELLEQIDPPPLAHKEAMAALAAMTGHRHKSTAEHWITWWREERSRSAKP